MVIPKARRSVTPTLTYPFLVALLLLWSDSSTRAPSAAVLGLNGALLIAVLVASTAAHEAAHALVARGVGLQPVAIFLGRGPGVWARKVGDVELVLQASPFTGVTYVVAPTRHLLRARLVAMYAAGPLANAAICAVAVRLASSAALRGDLATAVAPAFCVALVNGFMAASNAFPWPPRTRRATDAFGGSDGWKVLQAPSLGEDRLTAMLSAYASWRASALAAAGRIAEATALADDALARDPRSAVLRVLRTDLLVGAAAWADAAAALRALLADPESEGKLAEALPTLANNLAWADFMLDDPALLDEAERWSSFAHEREPRAAFVQGTRGAVLLARGELDRAAELLHGAFGRNTGVNRALNACCLAMLHARRGGAEEAGAWLGRARDADAGCSLLRRAEAAVTGAPG